MILNIMRGTKMRAKDVEKALREFEKSDSSFGELSVTISNPWHFNSSRELRIPFESEYGIYLFTKPSLPSWDIGIDSNDQDVWYVGKSVGDIGGRVWNHVGRIYDPETKLPCSPRFKFHRWADVDSIDPNIRKAVADGNVVVYTIRISATPTLTHAQKGLLSELAEKYVLVKYVLEHGKPPALNFQL
jgi:hypothetical protein